MTASLASRSSIRAKNPCLIFKSISEIEPQLCPIFRRPQMTLVRGLFFEEFAEPCFEHFLREEFVAVHAGNRVRPICSLLIGGCPYRKESRLLLFGLCRPRPDGDFVPVHPPIGSGFRNAQKV